MYIFSIYGSFFWAELLDHLDKHFWLNWGRWHICFAFFSFFLRSYFAHLLGSISE